MIQIYENKPIEVIYEGEDAFFKAQEVFKALDLTWRNVTASLRARGIKDNEIRRGLKLNPLTDSDIPKTEGVYITEKAVYKLCFRSNKPKAEEFTDWVAGVIKQIRVTGKYEITHPINLQKHLDRGHQVENSKAVNAKNFNAGGKDLTIEYNRKSMLLHTGKTPSQVKEIGKKNGLNPKQTSSAKEVLRNMKPELAVSMSFTDNLVTEENLPLEKASQISKELATPLFKALMDAGVKFNS